MGLANTMKHMISGQLLGTIKVHATLRTMRQSYSDRIRFHTSEEHHNRKRTPLPTKDYLCKAFLTSNRNHLESKPKRVAGTPKYVNYTTHHAKRCWKVARAFTGFKNGNSWLPLSLWSRHTTVLNKSWWETLQQAHLLFLSHLFALCCGFPFLWFPSPCLASLQQWAESLFELDRTSRDPAISSSTRFNLLHHSNLRCWSSGASNAK